MIESPKRGEKTTTHSATIQKDDSGELFIKLPDELVKQLDWRTGDDIEWDTTLNLGDYFDDEICTLRNLTQEVDSDRFKGNEY